ncbi:MAG: protein kinase [Blastocatellia bacterium]|nr:protein kinase [Blastocatellia bacterium]
MKPEYWKKLDALFHEALALLPEARAAFLAEACSGDEHLREEVERLIAAHEREDSFLDTPVLAQMAEFAVERRESLVGHRIGPYQVTGFLGQGGMGEVYLAEDTRLGRKVALKLLPELFTKDEDRLHRFAQEARAASALNHPNILTIYEIGEATVASGCARYIVAEYIEGQTLREQMRHGQLRLTAALDVARQVASALEAAHAAGVVHRDIKPDNVMVRRDGLVKTLDFGLAKLTAPTGAETDEPAAPQLRTKSGVVMGTVAYMSPEQARGQKVDHRTDIFSLGIVLYEMVYGQRPFQGESEVDTLHAIIHQEPPPVELTPPLPAEVTDILGKALAKELSERYRHAGDFELDLRRLKRAVESNSLASANASPSARQQVWWATGRARLMWVIIGALVIGASILAGWLLGGAGRAPTRAVALEDVTLMQLTTDPGYEGEPTFSADGETIAYVSDRTGNFEIFIKQISGGPDINLTNDPADDVQPAFSPDGKQIAFVSSRSGSSDIYYPGNDMPPVGGDIWVMPALGGAARRIVEGGNFPSWSPDGSAILYTSGPYFAQKMYRVAAQGGDPQEIALKFKPAARIPRFLLYPSYSSDERWIVFEVGGTAIGSRDIYVVRAEGGEAEHIALGQRPIWSADSRAVVYSNGEPGKNYALWQIPFSTKQGIVSGRAEPLTVSRGRDMHATISRDGRQIAFAAVEILSNAETLGFDAEAGRYLGAPQPLTSGSGLTYYQSFSADYRAIVFEARQGASSHLWRMDRGRAPAQLTADPDFADTFPRWSPDGRAIAFNRRPAEESLGATSLWLMADDGGNPHLLIEKAGFFTWMPDSRGIIYLSQVDSQIYFFDLNAGSARPLTNEPKIAGPMTTSLDGQWVIFQSMQTGSSDLHRMAITGGESRSVVATPHQDQHPSVSPSGRWLYFESDHKNLWRVPGPAQNWRQAEPEKVTNFPESGLFLEDSHISRDGRWLLYSRGRVTGDIWIMRLGK